MMETPPNPSAFRSIDTHEKAYLLGFLLADGCIRATDSSLSVRRVNLRIKAEDMDVCRRLQALAGGTLRLIERGYRAAWEINSPELASDLVALGITPRKSFTASLNWKAIPPQFHGAVLAGLIDGDGHLRFDRAKNRAGLTLVTASSSLKDQLLARFTFFKLVLAPPKGRQKSMLYRLEVECNREKLRALINTTWDSLPFPILYRKQIIVEELRAHIAEQDDWDRRIETIPSLKAQGRTLDEIAQILDMSLRPILTRLKQLGIKSNKAIYEPQDIEQMEMMHKTGYSVLQIHAAIGKGTEQAVRYHLQRLGCLQKQPQRQLRHARADEVLKLHLAGVPAYRIAEQTGLGRLLVRKILKLEGVSLTSGSPQKLTNEGIAYAKEQLQLGRSCASIARELGVSATLIRIRLSAEPT